MPCACVHASKHVQLNRALKLETRCLKIFPGVIIVLWGSSYRLSYKNHFWVRRHSPIFLSIHPLTKVANRCMKFLYSGTVRVKSFITFSNWNYCFSFLLNKSSSVSLRVISEKTFSIHWYNPYFKATNTVVYPVFNISIRVFSATRACSVSVFTSTIRRSRRWFFYISFDKEASWKTYRLDDAVDRSLMPPSGAMLWIIKRLQFLFKILGCLQDFITSPVFIEVLVCNCIKQPASIGFVQHLFGFAQGETIDSFDLYVRPFSYTSSLVWLSGCKE